MEEICDDGMNIGDLLHKLRTVERSINPGTDAKVILLPGASIMSECTLMSDRELLRVVTQRAKLFVDFFMNDKYGDTSLEEALLLYAEFHILEGQPVEWSNEHSFKCNCPHFCQWASCHHGLLCTMVCKPSLVVPPNMSGWVCIQGASAAGPGEVTKGRVKARSLVVAVIGYSRQKVIQCQRLQPSWRPWIQKMMFSQHLVAPIRW